MSNKFKTLNKAWKRIRNLNFSKIMKSIKTKSKGDVYKKTQVPNVVSAIYIDKLYTEPAVSIAGETSRVKEVVNDKGVGVGKHRNLYSVEDVWSSIVASSPQLRGVDERAEDFILKFREDMKLQKERSLLEFYDMLKRSA